MLAPILSGLLVLIQAVRSQEWDMDCNATDPFRCLDGVCRNKCTQKNTLMHFGTYCYTAANPYHCINGLCTSSYQTCVLASQGNATLAEREKCNNTEYHCLTQACPDQVSRRLLQAQLLPSQRHQRAVLRLQYYPTVPLRRRQMRSLRTRVCPPCLPSEQPVPVPQPGVCPVSSPLS